MPSLPSVISTTATATASRTAAARLQRIQRQIAASSVSAGTGQRGIVTPSANSNKRRMVAQKRHKVAIVGSGNWWVFIW